MGNINRGHGRLSQTFTGDLSGGADSDQFVTTIAGAKVNGNIAIWSDGMVVDSGVSLAAVLAGLGALQDSFGNPIVTSGGDPIYG